MQVTYDTKVTLLPVKFPSGVTILHINLPLIAPKMDNHLVASLRLPPQYITGLLTISQIFRFPLFIAEIEFQKKKLITYLTLKFKKRKKEEESAFI